MRTSGGCEMVQSEGQYLGGRMSRSSGGGAERRFIDVVK